MTKSENFQL